MDRSYTLCLAAEGQVGTHRRVDDSSAALEQERAERSGDRREALLS
jgi:hypothetical protein